MELNLGRAGAGSQELSHQESSQRMAVWATAGSLAWRSGPGLIFHAFWGLFSDQKKNKMG